jgi:hypothetical protein
MPTDEPPPARAGQLTVRTAASVSSAEFEAGERRLKKRSRALDNKAYVQ